METEKSKMTMKQAFEVLSDADYTISDLLGLARNGQTSRECMDQRVDSDGDLSDDEAEALAAVGIEVQGCECAGCNCGRPATTTDDGGVPVCRACSDYMCTEDGDVVCGRMSVGTDCHVCHEEIEWSGICTGNPGSGSPNYRHGACQCGDHAWLDEERGNWGHYRYGAD